MAKKKEEVLEEVEVKEEKCLISELHVSFNSEDMNKLVEKLNEVIRKQNGNR